MKTRKSKQQQKDIRKQKFKNTVNDDGFAFLGIIAAVAISVIGYLLYLKITS